MSSSRTTGTSKRSTSLHATKDAATSEATYSGEVMPDIPAGIVLPPFPGAEAVERKPLSAEQILEINPELSTEQLNC